MDSVNMVKIYDCQIITSADTSCNQIPCTHKVIDFSKISVMLDYGCGKFNRFKNLVESQGVQYFGYDKYNRTEIENDRALKCKPDIITCNNVLNVIDCENTINEIIREISSYRVTAVFCVYEGDKSGIGKTTKKGTCYQRNEKACVYQKRLEKYFRYVIRKGNIFICNSDPRTARFRSVTPEGVARAMAEQWG